MVLRIEGMIVHAPLLDGEGLIEEPLDLLLLRLEASVDLEKKTYVASVSIREGTCYGVNVSSDGRKVYVVTESREFAAWMEPCHRDVMLKRFAGGNGEGLKGKPFEHPVAVIPGMSSWHCVPVSNRSGGACGAQESRGGSSSLMSSAAQ